MARIRSIKPELRTDLTVAEWPREVRYAWVLLLGYLDDYGRGRDDSRLVVADLFPLDRDVTERKINIWLDRMVKSGPLCRYNVDGQGYFHAVKWSNHQRISHPTDSRLPPCPIHDLHEPIPSDTGTEPESRRNGSGEIPEPFRPSRAPAEQGAGSREQVGKGAGEAPPGVIASAIRNYVDACPTPPAAQLQAQIERNARTLIAEGHPPEAVIRAAANAGRSGYTNLAQQIQIDASRASPTNGRPATSDARADAAVQAGRALKAQMTEQGAIE
jgi:hypothetical protein